jgi:phage-related protein
MAFLTFTPPRPPGDTTTDKPEVSVLANDFGSGYVQSVADGLNNIRRVMTLTWETLVPTDFQALDSFLRARRGCEPFFWTPSDETTPILWTCKEWDNAREMGGFYRFSATFRQSFVPA